MNGATGEVVRARRPGSAVATIAAVAAVALLPTGCSADGSRAGTPSSSAATDGASGSGPGADADLATTTFPVDLDRALAVAGQTQPDGTVTKIEKSYDQAAGTWIWKIDSQRDTDQHEIKVDAQSGRVLADDRDQESANPKPVDPRQLTPEEAEARALAVQPGSVAKWALEYDDGVQRYAFDIRTSGTSTQGVIVDVRTGTASKK